MLQKHIYHCTVRAHFGTARSTAAGCPTGKEGLYGNLGWSCCCGSLTLASHNLFPRRKKNNKKHKTKLHEGLIYADFATPGFFFSVSFSKLQ